jgi:hypothetical protein
MVAVVDQTVSAASKHVAAKFVEAGKSGLQAIVSGIVVLRCHAGVGDKTEAAICEEIWRALNKSKAEGGPGFTRSTCDNKMSRIKTAGLKEFFPWEIDVNLSIAENVNAIIEPFSDFWHGAVENIKKDGPADRVKAERTKKIDTAVKSADAAPAATEAPAPVPAPAPALTLADANLVQLLAHLDDITAKMNAEQLAFTFDKLSAKAMEIDAMLREITAVPMAA